MTKVAGQHDQLIISQAVERLVQAQWQAESERDKAYRQLSIERNERSAPIVTSRDMMARIEILEQQKQDLIDENDQLRDYMRLKDNAKLKVERDRDRFKQDAQYAKKYAALCEKYEAERLEVDRDLDNLKHDVTRLENTVHLQNVEYKDLEEELKKALEQVLEYARRVSAMEEAIVLGKKGIEAFELEDTRLHASYDQFPC